MFSKISIVALFAGLVAAQATPKGDPSGNPITRPLNEIVPACKPFTITWQPTTPNSVSLVLLKGPSTNVVPIGNIVVSIPNSGSFVWTPSSALEATTGPTGYGIQLIDDVTGQYQYSTQFGISKGAECNSYVTPTPSSSQYGGGYPASTPVPSSSKAVSHSVVSSTKIVTSTVKHTSVVYSTGVPMNSTVIMPTKSMSVPSSLLGSATASGTKTPTTSAPAQQTTNAAAGLKAGLGMVGAAAAFAFML